MQIKKQKGISLIEVILYLALVVFVLGALFSYGWNVIRSGIKAQTVRETTEAARLITERLNFEIRQADSVDRQNSVFKNTPAKLVLVKNGENVVFEIFDNKLTVKRGAANAVPLQSEDISAKNFIFEEQVSESDETESVSFSFSIDADYPGSLKQSDYQNTETFRSGAALRKY